MLTPSKKYIEPLLEPLVLRLGHVSPSSITAFGLISPLLFIWALSGWHLLLAFLALLLAPLDMIDGAVARKYKKETAFGAVLDSSVDRVSDSLYISAFGFAGLVRWEIVIPVLVASFTISYLRSRAELAAKKTINMSVGWIERTERIVLIGLAVVAQWLIPGFGLFGFFAAELVFVILLILSLITVFQRTLTAYSLLTNEKS